MSNTLPKSNADKESTHTAAEPAAELMAGLSARDLMAQMLEPTMILEGGAMGTLPTVEHLTSLFPQLEILGLLGQGGMAVVYKARQKSLNRLVALKLLSPERVGDPVFAAYFEKEAQALARLNHPHIVGVYDFGEAGGHYYLLMEYVDGVNLRELMLNKQLSPTEALSLVPPICEALQCAHDHQVVHCDIKPENLLLSRSGEVKIADFGIARILEQAAGTQSVERGVAGTPAYAAPEQAAGQADHRADIYSLGVVIYEMLTGERPQGQLPIVAPSRRAMVDVRIDQIVLRTLERQPDQRYATADDLRTSLQAVMIPTAPLEQAVPTAGLRRRRLLLASGLVASTVLSLVLGRSCLVGRELEAPRTPGGEIVSFNSGQLSDSFTENVLRGTPNYTLIPQGLEGSMGIAVANDNNNEGTLVYTKQSYNLSQLASLEIACSFKWAGADAGTHTLALGLLGSTKGHLSGVKGPAFMALRLKPDQDALRFQFMSKGAQDRDPGSWLSPYTIAPKEGSWYRLQVILVRMGPEKVRVTGTLAQVEKEGTAGTLVAHFLPRDFHEQELRLSDLLAGSEVWVAVRADGPGGVRMLDDLQIVARPLKKAVTPEQTTTPTPVPVPAQ